MNFTKYSLLFSLLALLACQSNKRVIQKEGTLIKGVHLIPMTENAYSSPKSVYIKNGKIAAIGDLHDQQAATVIDGKGKYLLPGLTEMHAHIPVPKEGDTTLVKETLFLYLSQGITNIRGMLGQPYHLLLKNLVKEGKILGPRIYTSSPSLNGNTMSSSEIAEEKIKQYKKDGYDFLKIHPGIKLEVWETIERTAKYAGIPYAGHVPVEVGIHRALEAQYQTIDHLDGYLEGLVADDATVNLNENGFFGYGFTEVLDNAKIPDLVAKTKQLGVAVIPTQTLFTRWFSPQSPSELVNEPEMKYMSPKTRFTWRQSKERILGDSTYTAEKWERFIDTRKKLLQEMHQQGVTILLGSDAPQVFNVPGFSIHHEMKVMAEAGMPVPAILASGTTAPAKFFSAESAYGSIQIGAAADLVLLNKNPLDNIEHTKTIEGVMVGGKWLSRTRINEKLYEIEKRYEEL